MTPDSTAIATAIVKDRRLRRRAMVYAILVAAAQCLVGSTLLPESLAGSLFFNLLFWGFCLLMVVIAVGLALLDMLKLRQQLTSGLRDLEDEYADVVPEEEEPPRP